MNYADAFKAIRHAYRLTQVEFAQLLRVSKPTIQKLEAGDYPPSEKITAGLVELFRSERFRGEFRSRVEAGDLHSVRAAFGDLLDLVDGEKGVPLPSALSSITSTPNLADVYADLRKDYTEFREIVLSQQTTIQTLSRSTENLSESAKNWSESGRNLSESNKNLSESIKNLTGDIASKGCR
ncbi:MAG: helix-turn-helix transcriptional regulator [Chitinispirillales bacterium]|jgi:DNA-binding XRE family transcriptional regulator|nr:helix-turn-helix transcriptional regulator [Chitinispirillales bacterium]